MLVRYEFLQVCKKIILVQYIHEFLKLFITENIMLVQYVLEFLKLFIMENIIFGKRGYLDMGLKTLLDF